MDKGLIVGIFGVVVGAIGVLASVATYALGRRHGRREREADRREARINQFVNDYVDRSRRHINTGLTALVPAGVFRLENDQEIREALDICKLHLGKHPLGSSIELLGGTDLKVFFDAVASSGDNFARETVEQVLTRVKTTAR